VTDPAIATALLSGAFAFVGVVLAQFVVVWSQRRKVFDEDMRRWQTERRALYARIYSESDALDSRIASCITRNNPSDLPNIHDRTDYLIAGLFDEVLLIGSPNVVEASKELDAQILARLIVTWRYAIDGQLSDMDENEAKQFTIDQRMAQIKFLQAARNELLTPWKSKSYSTYRLFPDAPR
jgi:hypothetical protein